MPVYNLAPGRFASLKQLLSIFKVNKVKILHLHGLFLHVQVMAALLGLKVILKTTLLGSDDFSTLQARLGWPLIKQLIALTRVNVVLSNETLKLNRGVIPRVRILKIPNGVDIQNVVCEKRNIFCCIGVVCQRKGTLESIRFFIRHYSHVVAAEMYVVGPVGGTGLAEEDLEYIAECKRIAEKAACKITFTGSLPKRDVIKLIQKAKVMLLFSKKEGMPNVALEAMAANCLPLMSPLDGVSREILPESLQKFVVSNPSNFTPLSISQIDEIICSEVLREHARKAYSIESIAQRYDYIYTELNG